MHFSTHQNILISAIKRSLLLNKARLITEFKEILTSASKLFKTDQYEFWLNTLECVAVNEIPITKLGHNEAVNIAENLQHQDRNVQARSIYGICENLFTYSNENEMCAFQSDFHFYCLKETGAVFKLSELGELQGVESVSPNSYRIAYTSELRFSADELYS